MALVSESLLEICYFSTEMIKFFSLFPSSIASCQISKSMKRNFGLSPGIIDPWSYALLSALCAMRSAPCALRFALCAMRFAPLW
jgi:hypothetical protein